MARQCPVTHWTSHIYHILSYFAWFREYCDIAQDYSVRRQIGRNVVKKKSVAALGTIIKAHYCEWWLYTDIFSCSCSQYPPYADNPALSVLRTAWTRLSINLVNVAEFWLEVDMAETDVPEIELIIKASTIDGRRKGACIFCQVWYCFWIFFVFLQISIYAKPQF